MTTLETEGGAERKYSESLTVTAHLRAAPSSPASRRQQSVMKTLDELEADGTIPELAVERRSKQVTVPVLDEDSGDAGAVELFEAFESAADEAGIRLEPFFETREAVGGLLSSGPTNEEIIVFPVICLTIRREGDLTGLYPCWNDGVHESIEDCLGALGAGEGVENLLS